MADYFDPLKAGAKPYFDPLAAGAKPLDDEFRAPTASAGPSAAPASGSVRADIVESASARAEIGKRFAFGAKADFLDPAALTLVKGLEDMAPEGAIKRWLSAQRESVEAANQSTAEEFRAQGGDPNEQSAARTLGSIVPGVAAGMAAGPGVAANALVGGALGMAQPTEQGPGFWQEKIKQFLTGAAIGGAATAAGKGVSKLLSPRNPAEVKMLREGGVDLLPGQVTGGAIGRAEQGTESIPLVGDIVRSARAAANDSFNLATIDRALAVVGEKLEKGTKAGHGAVSQMIEKTSKIYDDILPRLGVRLDQGMHDDIARAVADNLDTVAPEVRQDFNRYVNTGVMARFRDGNMTGEEMKKVESFLTQKIKDVRDSSMVDKFELAGALTDVRTGLRNLVMRNNPTDAPMLSRVNTAYAMQLRIEKAAAKSEHFTPSQLETAVKQRSSATTRQAAEGDALLQEWAEAAKKVMGSRVPDSGTPYRALLSLGMLGGAGAMAHPAAAIAPATIAGIYSSPALRSGLATALTKTTGLSRIPGAAAVPLGQNIFGGQ